MINVSSSAKLLPAAVLLLAASACGQASAAAGSAEGAIDPDTMAVRVDRVDGPQQAAATLTRLPVLLVYGDGRVLTEKAPRAGAALPTILQRQISTASVRALVDRAIRAGVGTKTDFGTPPATDPTEIRFTVTTGAGVRTMQVTALSDTGIAGLTPAQQDARQAARDLLAALSDLPGTLGADAVGPAQTYVPTGIAAIATPWSGYCLPPPPGVRLSSSCRNEPPASKAQPWPGPALPGQPISAGMPVPCVTVTGHAATVLSAADASTPWSSDGTQWRVSLRPLLPGEAGCANLSTTNEPASATDLTTVQAPGPALPTS